MKTRKTQVTTTQVDRLLGDIRARPAQPVGDHLSDDECIGYAMETLPAEQVARVDTHLAACPDCAIEMERLLEASEAWCGEPGKQRLAALRERLIGQLPTSEQLSLRERLVLDLQEAVENWQKLFSGRKLAWAASTDEEDRRKIWNWQSDDGLLRGHAVLERNGKLTFRFVSKELGLEGERFSLRLGHLRREVVLRRVAETEVGAKVIVPAHERPADPADISLERA
jgi:hypothetical protein